MKVNIFRIYPFKRGKEKHDKSCWWRVIVAKNKYDLRKLTASLCDKCKRPHWVGKQDHIGLTHCHARRVKYDNFGLMRTSKPSKEIGVIFLNDNDSGSEVVSHESCHASLYTHGFYANIIDHDSPFFGSADEQLAYICGNLVNQIGKKLWN